MKSCFISSLVVSFTFTIFNVSGRYLLVEVDAEMETIQNTLIKDAHPKDKMCSACKMGVETMESMLGDEHDPEKIKEALTAMCLSLPKEFQEKCKQTMGKEHIALIIEEILKGDTPEMICQNMGWCDKTAGVQGINSIACSGLDCLIPHCLPRGGNCDCWIGCHCCAGLKCRTCGAGVHHTCLP